MGLSGLSIFAHGWHHPGLVEVEVCATPTLTSVVEVRPTIRATVPPEPVGEPGTPSITAASELSPIIQESDGEQQVTSQDEPHVISAEELAPTIVDTEEE